MRLANRMGLLLALLGAVSAAVVGTLAFLLAAREARAAVDAELRARAALVTSLPQDVRLPPGARLDGPVDPTELATRGFSFAILDASGRRLAGTDVPLPSSLDDVLDGSVDEVVATVPSGEDEVRVLVTALDVSMLADEEPLAAEVRAVALSRDVTEAEAALRRTAIGIVAVGVVSTLVLGTAGVVVGRRIARPLVDLAEVADALSRAHAVAARIEVDRADEVGRLADAFNRMLGALEVSREQQQRLVADASHELRTPLAALRTRTEFLAANPDLAGDVRERTVRHLADDAVVLTDLVSDLVDLATDVRGPDEPAVPVDLDTLVRDVAERAGRADGRVVAVEGRAGVVVGHEAMLARGVRNLVDNALTHGAEPVVARLDAGRVTLHDAGEGIDAADRPRVFDRFYRSARARSRPGNGIGLAIVAQVADAHDGDTWVERSPLGGAAVGFSVGTRARHRGARA